MIWPTRKQKQDRWLNNLQQLQTDTRKATIRRKNGLQPLTHSRLLQMYTASITETEEITLSKKDRSCLIHFRSGHHTQHRRWQTPINRSESAECRLCGEAEESAEHLWLRRPTLDAARHILDLGCSFDELVRLPIASLALRRLGD